MAASPRSVSPSFLSSAPEPSPNAKGKSDAVVEAVARRKLEKVDGDRASRDYANSLITEVTNGSAQSITKLLGARADINVTDKNGCTALFHAVEQGKEAILKVLLNKGADPNAVDEAGHTPLHMAARWGRKAVFLEHCDVGVNMVQALLEAGANPNAANEYGYTPLYEAAEAGYVPIVKELLRAKADPNLLTVKNFDHIDSQSCALSLVKEGFNKMSPKELLDHWVAKKWSSGELEDFIRP